MNANLPGWVLIPPVVMWCISVALMVWQLVGWLWGGVVVGSKCVDKDADLFEMHDRLVWTDGGWHDPEAPEELEEAA